MRVFLIIQFPADGVAFGGEFPGVLLLGLKLSGQRIFPFPGAFEIAVERRELPPFFVKFGVGALEIA
ncbi:MAG: hypothetical protein J6Z30_04010, partial [Pyramidobacter sp.]|nr:hypothetical protein [Pyramidobacter sp.]